jgi:hypothetical protein
MESFTLKKNIDFDDNILINTSKILHNQPYLLNTETIGNTVIEKFIYNIASHHVNLNSDLNNLINDVSNNSVDTFIEFQFNVEVLSPNNNIADNIRSYSNQYNENDIDKPNISCVTFLNNSNISFITSDVSTDEYKFKKINNKKLDIAIHNKFNHIIYDSNNMYCLSDLSTSFEQSIIDNDKSITLFIHIWNKKPNIPTFSYDTFTYQYYSKYKQKLHNLTDSNDIIDINDNSENVFIALGRNSSEGFKHEYLV